MRRQIKSQLDPRLKHSGMTNHIRLNRTRKRLYLRLKAITDARHFVHTARQLLVINGYSLLRLKHAEIAVVLKPFIAIVAPILRTLLVGLASGLIAFACLRFLLPAPSATLLNRHAEALSVTLFLDAHGVNKPLLAAYFELLADYARGDFGYSWVNQVPVGPLIANALG